MFCKKWLKTFSRYKLGSKYFTNYFFCRWLDRSRNFVIECFLLSRWRREFVERSFKFWPYHVERPSGSSVRNVFYVFSAVSLNYFQLGSRSSNAGQVMVQRVCFGPRTIFFKNGPFPASPSLFSSFQYEAIDR